MTVVVSWFLQPRPVVATPFLGNSQVLGCAQTEGRLDTGVAGEKDPSVRESRAAMCWQLLITLVVRTYTLAHKPGNFAEKNQRSVRVERWGVWTHQGLSNAING